MLYLKYYTYFLLKENPLKSLLFCLTFLLYFWGGQINISENKINDVYNITWVDTTQKKIVYINKDGLYKFYEYSGEDYKLNPLTKTLTIKHVQQKNDVLALIIVIAFVVCLIVSIITILVEILDDSFVFFDLVDVKKYTLRKLVIMDEDGGVRYYHLLGRLIFEDKGKGGFYSIESVRDLNKYLEKYMENSKILPKWSGTKQDKRDNLLNKILN